MIRLVIKVGTKILTTANGHLDHGNMAALVAQICQIKAKYSCQVILVSSGAIISGSEVLGIQPNSVPEEQATAAVGQVLLMTEYHQLFANHSQQIAQILVSKDGLEDLDRRKNALNTINTLLEYGVIPIINENDTVSIDEIQFGDNDVLASLISHLIDAQTLILLTDQNGVYSSDPTQHSSAELLTKITSITDDLIDQTSGKVPHRGRGGIRSKLTSARFAQNHGINVVIANGRQTNVLVDILDDRPVGTRIYGKGVQNDHDQS
ncbi:glutamate 5-kinase [bacterium]|mgnify:CR=1 FL=1|jgi:glutamate 5-kinase|nr:glutamate 5-kinase [bacterium]